MKEVALDVALDVAIEPAGVLSFRVSLPLLATGHALLYLPDMIELCMLHLEFGLSRWPVGHFCLCLDGAFLQGHGKQLRPPLVAHFVQPEDNHSSFS
jgi:hypothetical protein